MATNNSSTATNWVVVFRLPLSHSPGPKIERTAGLLRTADVILGELVGVGRDSTGWLLIKDLHQTRLSLPHGDSLKDYMLVIAPYVFRVMGALVYGVQALDEATIELHVESIAEVIAPVFGTREIELVRGQPKYPSALEQEKFTIADWIIRRGDYDLASTTSNRVKLCRGGSMEVKRQNGRPWGLVNEEVFVLFWFPTPELVFEAMNQ